MTGYTHLRAVAGPMTHLGDRFVPDEEFSATAARIAADAVHDLPGVSMRIVRRIRVGSRSLDLRITSHPGDLAMRDVHDAAVAEIVDHAMRYGWDRSCYATDLVDRSFGVVVEIDPAYWGGRQKAMLGLGAGDMTPTAFVKAVRPGDVLVEREGRRSGRTYRVVGASAGRFVTDDGMGGSGRISWNRPAAECLHVDGDVVRIADGSPRDPDSHHSLTWTRTR